MGKTITEIAKELKSAQRRKKATTAKTSDAKVQLIYAFNGTGKTRLSHELKEQIDPKAGREAMSASGHEPPLKIIYYNAYTEDLFTWDNDLADDKQRKILIKPNGFTDLVFDFLNDQGQDKNIETHFRRYTNSKITPKFSNAFDEITFSVDGGDTNTIDNIKISKGEESNLIWCIFYSIIEQVIETLNEEDLTNRVTQKFNDLEYIFIDDPVSSLDDNNLIELAVNIAKLIKSSQSKLKFIITTHNPLFYNVLHNELNNDDKGYSREQCIKKRLIKQTDGSFELVDSHDSPFSYHLFLLSELEQAIQSGNVEKYHFNFLRNILEKTATFLGYRKWQKLLPEDKRDYYNRVINLYSHSKHHGEDTQYVEEKDKIAVTELVEMLKTEYHFRQE